MAPGIFGIVQGIGLLSAQDPAQSLGLAAFGAVTQAVGTFVERSYRWRVTSQNLVHGRLRWPFLRGGGSVALDRIPAVQTTSARSGWGIKRAVEMGGGDVGRVPPWTRGAVIVHVDAGRRGAHRLVVATSTAAGAEEMAGVLRAVSGASAEPPGPPSTAEREQRAPVLQQGAQRRATPQPQGQQPQTYEGQQSPETYDVSHAHPRAWRESEAPRWPWRRVALRSTRVAR